MSIHKIFSYTFIYILLITLVSYPLLSQESMMSTEYTMLEQNTLNNQVIGENITDKQFSFTITAKDTIYTLSDSKEFTLTITNISTRAQSLVNSNDYIFNVFFNVYDELYLPVSPTLDLMKQRNTPYITNRNITLYPSEFFSITLDLNKFVDINQAGIYRINTRFYPSTYTTQASPSKVAQAYLESNLLLISVVSDTNINNESNFLNKDFIDIPAQRTLITREYNPYDVMQEAMNALSKKDWDTFLSHIHLTTFLY